jgi:tetratricopeptide (TPR) repeat protein
MKTAGDRVTPWRAAAIAAILAVLTALPSAQGGRSGAAARAGWEAIRAGRAADAAAAFADALAVEPRDPTLHLGAGLAAHLLGQATAARHALERALALAPGYTAASLLLGEILYRGSDLEGAIRVYEEALAQAPNPQGGARAREQLTARLAAWRREAELHSGFFQRHGAHFTVLFEGPADEDLARRAVERLEEAYWRIGTALATYPEQVITVVLYTQQQFRDITRSPAWAAASYDGRIRVPMRGALSRPEELERVLAHEFTHALVRSIAARGVPTWLNEGLAVLFEPGGLAWAKQQVGGTRTRLSHERLAGSFEGLSTTDARLAYAQSAIAVERAMELAGTPAVVELLRDLARGEAFDSAFERRTLVPFERFVGDLR